MKDFTPRLWLFIGMAALLLTSCNKLFDTHPYSVHIHGERRLNSKQIEKIESNTKGKDTLRVAFISDTHDWYTAAKEEVRSLNQRTDIDFVVHCGDLTDVGTDKEYSWVRDILNGLRYPYVALIGNHDYLGTGDQAYEVLYGDMDFTFIAARVKFVCVNTNATEYDYIAAVPDFNFMEKAAVENAADFDRTVVIMHAPPYSDQFNNNVCKPFRQYLDLFPGLLCCIYGHEHEDKVWDIYEDGLLFYSIDSAVHRNYRIMTITPDGYEMEQVFF